MGLANFFSKNALAAAQILGGMTPDVLANVLDRHTVAICFDEAAAGSAEGRTTIELTVNLAARLYPRIAVSAVGSAGRNTPEVASSMQALARAINPAIDFGALDQATVAVVVGQTALPAGATAAPETFYVGSDAWWALLSAGAPVGCGDSNNPFGAAAAACFAMANVFRVVFAAYLENPERDTDVALSLFDYSRAPTGAMPGRPGHGGLDFPAKELDLGETILGGVGAIGNAAVWSLARVARLSGTLHLVDGESVTLTNLQRYVLATQADVASRTMKVDMASGYLRTATTSEPTAASSALALVPHPVPWEEFVARRDSFALGRVATAFDSVDARLAVQAALPRRLVNAWTQHADLGVSRHYAFGVRPCLGCLYRLRAGGKSEAELVADTMRVPGEAYDIRELLYSGAPIGEDFIRGVAARRGLTDPGKIEVLLTFASAPLREFYQEAFCGGLMLQLEGEAGMPVRAEAPIAFQSALAGVMVAAEIVIDALALRTEVDAPPPRTVIDLLRPLSVYEPDVSRRTDGACICNDDDYRQAYSSKYETVARDTFVPTAPTAE